MGVSKIAVIALVAVIAVPILLGYGLNLTETTETTYTMTGDSVNVTPLLQSGTGYTSAEGNVYQLNTEFETSPMDGETFPIYERSTTSKTTFPFVSNIVQNWGGGIQYLSYAQEYFISIVYPTYSATSYVIAQLYSEDTLVYTVNHVVYMYYNQTEDLVGVIEKTGGGGSSYNITGQNVTAISFTLINMSSIPIKWGVLYNVDGYFTDLAAGWHFESSWNTGNKVILPDGTFNVLVSINLDSITDANYSLLMNTQDNHSYYFVKTTTDGVVKWTVTAGGETYDLYYNPSISDNTYQFLIAYGDTTEPTNNPSVTRYYRHAEFRYVGHWPATFGAANYYQKYDHDYYVDSSLPNELDYVYMTNSPRSPTMRIDAAEFRAFEYAVIENNTYSPAEFKTNPATSITSIQRYGTSLEFGGNTYNVKDGNITLGTHDIPVDKLVFESVPNGSGDYENKIGNTLISTTATPSTITFNGKWSANVSTQAMEQTSYTKTEWIPGEFAWDGIDQNFLIVGLITCLGVFVALGIYARKRGTGGLIPLMIAVGCAAMVFFIML